MFLNWLLACQSGQVVVEKTPETDQEEICIKEGELSLDAQVDWFYWGGSDPLVSEFSATLLSEPCSGFVASSAAEWLIVEIDQTGLIRVELDPEFVISGHHLATISIWDEQVQEVLVEIPVELSALVSPQGNDIRKRALVVGVDGLDGEEMEFTEMPRITHLQSGGQWTRHASTQMSGSTKSGPGWTSILTGVEVDKHNVTSNGGYSDRNRDYPTFLKVLADEGFQTSGSIQWDDIFEIVGEDTLTASHSGAQQSVTDWMVERIMTEQDEVMFVHLDDVDIFGHASGFTRDSEPYMTALSQADSNIDELFDAILNSPNLEKEEWLIIVTSDHGGDIAGTHGTRTADYRQIPFVVAGPSVPKAEIANGLGNHMDVFSTALDFFDVDISPDVDGISWMELHESDCNDGVDNDGDGLSDCEDQDCLGEFSCQECEPDNLESNIGTQVITGLIPLYDNYIGSCGGTGGADEIFVWTAPSTGTFVMDTMDWYRDTVLYVFDGECTGDEVACNSQPNTSQRSVVSVDVQEGQKMSIVVDSNGDDSRETGLSIYPKSNPCESTVQNQDAWSESFSHVDTSFAGGCVPVIAPVWWEWTASEDGLYQVSTTTSDFDTVLYILDGCGGEVLTCNDDADSLYAGGAVSLLAGDTILIGVGSFAGRTSTGTIGVSVYQE